MTPSELERDRYESRLKAQRDMDAALDDARNEGWKRGYERGFKKEAIKSIHMFQRLLRRTLTPPETLAEQETAALERFADNLEAELAARLGNKT
jgi:hypothetical protein